MRQPCQSGFAFTNFTFARSTRIGFRNARPKPARSISITSPSSTAHTVAEAERVRAEEMHGRVARIAFPGQQCHRAAMNMAELMREVSNLPAEQQKELAAYLLHLRLQQDAAWRSEMTRRIDDPTSTNWVDLQDWKKEVKKNGGE